VNVHIADVPTGNVRTAVAAQTSIDDILRAEKQLALEIFDKLGVGLTPKEQAAVEQLPTKNVDAFLAYSRGVRFEAEGRYSAAAKEYQQAVALDPGFKAAAAQLEAVQSAATSPAPTQQANSGAARAADVVADRLSPDFVSPIGGQQILSPFDGGADLPLPGTAIIITVTVPQ
jgi:tetratricopeptide (TPR) repeat protein